jgi:hypothetical protein
MFVQVDSEAGGAVTLEDAENFTAFHVQVVGSCDARRLDGILASNGTGSFAGESALIRVEALRRLAEGRVGDDWSQKLGGMVSYAQSKGWWHEESASIVAHVEGLDPRL